jgi:hypothetical protein
VIDVVHVERTELRQLRSELDDVVVSADDRAHRTRYVQIDRFQVVLGGRSNQRFDSREAGLEGPVVLLLRDSSQRARVLGLGFTAHRKYLRWHDAAGVEWQRFDRAATRLRRK